MQKHKFNIFPEMSNEEFEVLKQEISTNGYDHAQPIVIFNGAIIDGWNRYRVCTELNIKPSTKEFKGDDIAAINFTMSTNKRRNLSSGQWACIAIEAEELIAAIAAETEKARREKQSQTQSVTKKGLSENKFSDSPKKAISKQSTKKKKCSSKTRTATKVAKKFNTNQGYVNKAAKLKKEDPETFEKVKSGETTIAQVEREKKEAKKEASNQAKQAVKDSTVTIPEVTTDVPKRTPRDGEWWLLGRHRLYCGDTSKDAFKKQLTTCAFAFADPPYNADVAEWDNDFNWQHNYLSNHAGIVAVTPGIVSIQEFMKVTTMPYVWSVAGIITNGMTRGAVGFGNWIYTALFSTKKVFRNSQDIISCAIKTSESKETTHKGRKPSEFLALLFDKFTKEGDTIIDPFLGSGQTLLVCETSNRICIGGEMSPEFCADIISRWESLTKEVAINDINTI